MTITDAAARAEGWEALCEEWIGEAEEEGFTQSANRSQRSRVTPCFVKGWVGEVEEVHLVEAAVGEEDRAEIVNDSGRLILCRGKTVGTFASCNSKTDHGGTQNNTNNINLMYSDNENNYLIKDTITLLFPR